MLCQQRIVRFIRVSFLKFGINYSEVFILMTNVSVLNVNTNKENEHYNILIKYKSQIIRFYSIGNSGLIFSKEKISFIFLH